MVLILPLGGIFFLQIYENEIVRQKESALVAQGAYVATIYRQALFEELGVLTEETVNPGALVHYGLPLPGRVPDLMIPVGALLPTIDLMNETIRDPLPRLRRTIQAPDPMALAAGKKVNPILFRAQTMTLDTVRIVDVYANVIASTQGEEGLTVSTWQEVQQALQGKVASFVRQRRPPAKIRSPLDVLGLRPGLLVSVSIPIVENKRVLGAVVLTGVPSQVSEVLYGNRGQLLAAFGLLLMVAVLLAILTSLTITEPIQKLMQATRAIAKGEYRAIDSLRRPLTREIGELTDSLQTMANTIQERTSYIIAFARSVTHEFKTPLTSIRGSVELLKDHGDQMDAAERAKFLNNLEADAKRLDRLTGRLLELARADAAQPSGGVAWQAVVERVARRYEQKGWQVGIQLDGEEAEVAIPEAEFDSILTNLIENARQHGGEGVEIRVGGQTRAYDVVVTVSDNGLGISSKNRERVFDPFFTTARKSGGTGLGLSIVQSLIKAHGGSVELTTDDLGTALRLTIPKTSPN